MDRKEITERVIQALSQVSSAERDQIHLDHHLVDDLGMDSVDMIEGLYYLKEEFQVDLPEQERLERVQDIVNLIERNLFS